MNRKYRRKNMSKKLMAAVACVLAFAAVTSASDFDFWALADSDSVLIRLGLPVSDNVVAGVESAWRHDSERPGQLWALYGIYTHPDPIEFDNILPFDWMPALSAHPYIGASIGVDLENEDERTVAGPLAGLIVQDILVIEYAYQYVSDHLEAYMSDRYRLRVGLRIPF